jgi:hypothetical protein
MVRDEDVIGKMEPDEFLRNFKCSECEHFIIQHPELKHVWVERMASPIYSTENSMKTEHIEQAKTLKKYG